MISPSNRVALGHMSRWSTLTWANSRGDVFYYELQLSRDPSFNTDGVTAIAPVYGALIHVVAQDATAQEAAAHQARMETALREAGVEIRSMDRITPSLEDVFIASVQD